MKKKQIVLAVLALVLILLAFLGFIFQDKLQTLLETKQETVEISPAAEIAKDTIPYKEYLKKELGVIETKKIRKTKREIWRLGKGPAIINYLLKAQNHINLYDGKILEMEQTFHQVNDKSSIYQSANLDFLDFKGDTVSVELQITREIFVEGSSKISILFQATNLDPESFEQLSKQDYPFTLLATPWDFYPDSAAMKPEKWERMRPRIMERQYNLAELRNNPNCSFVVWPYLESTKLNSTHSRPIRIHHTKNEIQHSIRNAFELIPDAKGMATRFGEQAVEHKNLLTALLEPMQGKKLFFLDLTGTSPSETNNVCGELGLTCETFVPYNPDNSTIEFYIKKTLNEARKYGNTVMILPMKKDTWTNLHNIKELASKQGTEIIPLTALIDLRQ